MVLLCKNKALYVKACIIACGVTDSQGDTLYAEDIKKIFTSFNNQNNFEIYHNDLPISEVSLLENYISVADETLGTAVVPRGSWNAVIRVDNPDIKERLLTGEFKGVSLNNRIANKCKSNLQGTIRYKDVPDAECVIPLLISFVPKGANGYGLHVMDYNAYIKKSESIKTIGAENMEFKEFLDGVKLLIKKAEDTEEEEPVIDKEENPTEEEPVEDANIEKEDNDDATEDTEEDEDDEVEIQKEDDETNTDDLKATVREIIEEILKEKQDNDEDAVEDESKEDKTDNSDEDTPKITKSHKVINDTTIAVENTNYYTVSGRDPITGMKIRK